MPEEGFLRRWARVKATAVEPAVEAAPAAVPAVDPAPVLASVPVPGQAQQPAPTLVDAAALTRESDFSAFVSPNVGHDVRRLALKKLFADPHFNVLDRLDMYMDDYNKPDPVSATMLAALDHARGTLRRPEEVQAELARLAARDAPAVAADEVEAAPDTPPDPQPEEADANAAGDLPPDAAPNADEHDSDVIALTPVRAHNAQTSL